MSFVFSLKDDKLRKFKVKKGCEEVYHYASLINMKSAIYIDEYCNLNNKASTCLDVYEKPLELQENSNEAIHYLNDGNHHF